MWVFTRLEVFNERGSPAELWELLHVAFLKFHQLKVGTFQPLLQFELVKCLTILQKLNANLCSTLKKKL